MSRQVLVLDPKPAAPGEFPTCITEEGMHVYTIWDTEIEFVHMMCWMIKANQYKKVLEIGTNRGYTTWWLDNAVKGHGGVVHTVDIENRWEVAPIDTVKRYIMPSEQFLKNLAADEKFDFIFVDGDHTFLGALKDLIMTEHRINPGGAIVVHDTAYTTPGICEVPKAMRLHMERSKGRWMFYECGAGLAIGLF